MNDRARVLFVDDEKRVLNSMRGMFRRQFDLFLTTEGAAAVKIASENPIDVIVVDQRMPGMTGVEVLQKVKELSPNTIRILLTGYADPAAVEGSINVGEVFRFLGKPCPPKVLRETLDLAVAATRTATEDLPVLPATRRSAQTGDFSTAHSAAADSFGKLRSADTADRLADQVKEIGVVVYTVDAQFAETAIRALAAERSTTLATSLIKVMQAIEKDPTGVLITDITNNCARLQRIIGALKQYVPELVTVAVSDNRDTTDMISLINYGQVFRYALKPVAARQLRDDIDAAAVKHVKLCNDPVSVKRHTVASFPVHADPSPSLNHELGRIRELRSPWGDVKGGYLQSR